MLEEKIRFHFDSTGQVINLSTERFCRDTFKLLKNNLNFVPSRKTVNKNALSNARQTKETNVKLL